MGVVYEAEDTRLHRFVALKFLPDNVATAIALHFMHYNFCRVHQTLRVMPAMEARVADHVWTIQEVVALLNSN